MRHRVLRRQLRKLGLDAGTLPADEAAWQDFLDRISRAYDAADQDRYLLERSLAISSGEMQDLYDRLLETSEGRIAAERDKLRAVISSLGAGLCTLDVEGRAVSINPEGERLLGCAEADVLGRCFFRLVQHTWGQRDGVECGKAFKTLVATGRAYQEEDGVFARKDGTFFPVAYTLNPIREDETFGGAVLAFFDVSARKEAEEALRASEARYKQLVEHATDIIYRTDAQGRFTYCNAVAQQIAGYPEDEVLGRSFVDLVRPDYRTEVRLFYERQYQARIQSTYLEFPIVTADGRPVWIGQNVQPVWKEDRIVGFQAVARNITENKSAEEVLLQAKEALEERVAESTVELREAYQQLVVELTERREAERRIRKQATLLDRAQDAICVLDARDRITYWNKSAERLYGWTRDEALGCDAGDLLFRVAPDRYAEARALVLADGEWTGEIRQTTKDGVALTVESRWTFVREPEDESGSILLVNTDITAKKALEMQFLRAQRMESLGTLASGIAHDLNNILGPILMSTQMLRMKLKDERSRKLLHTMERSIQRGADLVRQVLSFARGVKGKRVVVPLRPLLAELAGILQDTLPRSIDVRVDVADDVWSVDGDETQLHQVLMNVCLNARDAMPAGGTLVVKAENVQVEAPYARLHVHVRPGPYVLVQVSDTGAGMPPEVQDKIFEPFFTTRDSGTGLGLSTALGILKGHGGFINVYSEVGRGTSFKIYLPASERAQASAPDAPALRTEQGWGELVLVVDDERDFREITRQLLDENGYRALTARDGVEALDLYRQYRSEVRAVITDIMMPAMDGHALIRALRDLDPGVRVIATSGLSVDENLADTAEAAVHAFLPKPYEATKLLSLLHTVLRGANGGGGASSR